MHSVLATRSKLRSVSFCLVPFGVQRFSRGLFFPDSNLAHQEINPPTLCILAIYTHTHMNPGLHVTSPNTYNPVICSIDPPHQCPSLLLVKATSISTHLLLLVFLLLPWTPFNSIECSADQFKGSVVAMAYEGSETNKGKKGHQPPRRGQVKARIIGSLVRSVLTMASKRGRAGKGQSEGEDSASTTMSPSSGYSSEAPSLHSGSKPQRTTPAPPPFFLSSTNSLDGFVVEVPKQVLCRYPALEPACRGRD